ncbi:MAG: late competence development ComFB family protein [Pseudanabaenaceae cyanobacterium]
MALLVNALEEVVANQAGQIIADLPPAKAERIRPREIIAYALNRLPPMYATSNRGFAELRARAINEMGYQIYDMLHRGIQRVLLSDPLYDPTPLPNSFFQDSASVLDRFCKLFNRDYMRWRDVVVAVRNAVYQLTAPPVEPTEDITVIQTADDPPTHPRLRAEMAGLKAYLRRAKAKRQLNALVEEEQTVIQTTATGWKQDTAQAYSVMIAYDELVLYLLRPRLRIVNVMEHLVSTAVQKISNPEVHEGSRPVEITAYALNRLPPLYATSINGYNISRQRGINELAKDIVVTVRNGALKVLRHPANSENRPFTTDFEGEAQETLRGLRKLLDREDIDLSNVVEVVQEFISPDPQLSYP